tara:strand:- start:103 stop:504 length:402 start_codon:yes stop_codon:yes gene_type:complete
MKGIELLEQNPESAKLICSYYLEIMLESLKHEGLPEDFKESIREQGIDNDKIGAILDGNPRNLFDFFDSHKIYIDVRPFTNGSFSYSVISDIATSGSSEVYKTRKEADKEAVEEAIKQLESTLTKSVSDKENS